MVVDESEAAGPHGRFTMMIVWGRLDVYARIYRF